MKKLSSSTNNLKLDHLESSLDNLPTMDEEMLKSQKVLNFSKLKDPINDAAFIAAMVQS
jgi:hypothetical protein